MLTFACGIFLVLSLRQPRAKLRHKKLNSANHASYPKSADVEQSKGVLNVRVGHCVAIVLASVDISYTSRYCASYRSEVQLSKLSSFILTDLLPSVDWYFYPHG